MIYNDITKGDNHEHGVAFTAFLGVGQVAFNALKHPAHSQQHSNVSIEIPHAAENLQMAVAHHQCSYSSIYPKSECTIKIRILISFQRENTGHA